MSGNIPVIPPSTCPEPIYQLTPGAVVSSATPLPVCPIGTPEPVYPTETTATAGVSQLPTTGGGSSLSGGEGLLLMLALIGTVFVLGWYSIRAAERSFDERQDRS